MARSQGSVAAGAGAAPIDGRALRLTLTHTFQRAHTGPIHVARFNTYGRYVLSAGNDRVVKLWNAQAGPGSGPGSSSDAATPITSYSAHSHAITALAISPTSSHFASGGQDKAVLLWDVATAQVLRRFTAHVGKVQDLVFAGSGSADNEAATATSIKEAQLLLCGGFDAKVHIYDLRQAGAWKPLMQLDEAKDAIMSIVVAAPAAASGRAAPLICTGSVDGKLRTYDLRMGQLRTDTIGGACCPHAHLVLIVREHGAMLTRPPSPPRVLTAPITSLTLSATSDSILLSTLDSTHRLLDLSDGTVLQSFASPQHTNTSYRCHSTLLSTPRASQTTSTTGKGAGAGAGVLPLSSGLDSTVLSGDDEGRLGAWDVLSSTHASIDRSSLLSSSTTTTTTPTSISGPGGAAPAAAGERSRSILWTEQSPASLAAVVSGKATAGTTGGVDVLSAGADGALRIWGFS